MDTSAKTLDISKPSGPVKVNTLTVAVNRDICIGAATCIAVAPKTFVLDSDAKAIILETANDEDNQTIIEAARACPVAAITVTDAGGKQIFP